MFGFLLGAITAGIATYHWHDRIRSYMNSEFPTFRDRAAERLGDLGDRANSALERARTRINSTVRSGQERLKSTPSGRWSEHGGTQSAPGPPSSSPQTRGL